MHTLWKRPKRVTVALVGIAGAVTAGVLAFPDGDGAAGPRPVSGAEAQRLALARFRTYQDSPSAVTVRAPTAGGAVEVRAVVDHRRHRAVGTYAVGSSGASGTSGASGSGLLAWDLAGIAVARSAARPSGPEQLLREARRPGPAAWTRRAYTADPLDTALRLTLSLSADRPDNAQLLAQAGPLWLRGDAIDGRDYDVFAGPRPSHRPGRSPLTYWIDTDGGLRRVTARIDPTRTATVDFTATRVRGTLPTAPWAHRPTASAEAGSG
ncbi:hypothetical protein [Streptomyces sp. TRM68416]|uniref:hypothetical protein n=1 Tax=Streptomyces sp. TRM68416 TaxID=2758412 RepID=UPI0016621C2D|nr:hypothetical protein [Streptomyces sp. TRM68416]MBD0840018.1 hypothetical protein [Streptomyces sp. TRM68416]